MERGDRYDEKLIRILDSACDLFADKGFHNTSVRDVATATDVSPAGLYYYFKSKEELLFLILEHSLGSLMERVREETIDIEEPKHLLKAIVRTHLSHFEAHGKEMRVLVHEWQTLSGPLGEEIRKVMWEYVALVIRTFRRLSPDKSSQELRAAAFGLFGMLTWVDQWYRPERDLPMELLADQFSEIFLQGFFSDGDSPTAQVETEEEAAAEAWAKLSSSFAVLSGPGF